MAQSTSPAKPDKLKLVGLALGAITRRVAGREVASRFIVNELSRMPGLPAKAGQLFAARLGVNPHDHLAPEMNIDQVKDVLSKELPELLQAMQSMEEAGKIASLSQVHMAKLKSGEEIAIKIQLPSVAQGLDDQWDLILDLASRFAPVELQSLALIEDLKQSFRFELDYTLEATNQKLFAKAFAADPSICIPAVHSSFCSSRVITQSCQRSIPLGELKLQDVHCRKVAAERLVRFMLESFFKHGLIHADMHQGNWGIDLVTDRLVVYDFGAVVSASGCEQAAVLDLIRGHRVKEAFCSLGFKDLSSIQDKLLDLTRSLFSPVFSPSWRPSSWSLKADLERLLGKQKWEFRQAGPAWFLLAMRSWSHVFSALEELDVEISIPTIWESLALPTLSGDQKLDGGKITVEPEMISRHLKIEVRKAGVVSVFLEFPAFSASQLSDLIPNEVRAKIQSLGINTDVISRQVIAGNFKPETLFEAKFDNQAIRVWLD